MKHVLWVVALGWGGVACGGSAALEGDPTLNVQGGSRGSIDPVHAGSGGAITGNSGSGGSRVTGGTGGTGGSDVWTGGTGGTVYTVEPVWSHPRNVVLHATDAVTHLPARCADISFTLDFAGATGAESAIASRDGSAVDLMLARQPDGSLLQSNDKIYLPDSLSCPANDVSLSGLTLRAVKGALIGTAHGTDRYNPQSDVAYPEDAIDVTVTGTLDSTAPTLLIGPTTVLYPTDRLSISASEALASVTAALTNSGAPVPLMAVPYANVLPLTMSVSTEQVLPFGGTWQLSGTGQDFAGNLLGTLAQTVTTIADPGVFAQDGFEGAVNALLPDANSKIVDDSFAIKPITGSRSLLIKVGGTATLHLQRTAGQTKLVFSVVDLIPSGTQPSKAQSGGAAAVIGGKTRVGLSWPVTGSNATSDDTIWPTASDPAHVEVPLTDAGSDVVVKLEAPASFYGPYGANGPNFPTDALLFDDVHME